MKFVFNAGATSTRAGISTTGHSIEKISVFPTNNDFDLWADELIKEAKVLGAGGDISEIGGGIAGVFDSEKDFLIRSPNLTTWEGKNIKRALQEKFNCRISLENDTAMEALGEANMGAGKGKTIVAYLTIGTGIGGALTIDGRLIPRWQGSEPGQQIIYADGGIDYWERFASGRAIKEKYGIEAKSINDPRFWDDEHQLLSIGIHNVIVMWSPEIIILGGGVSKQINIDKLKDMLIDKLKIFPYLPQISKSHLGEESGLVGALLHLRDK